jgi:IS30 family transposase
MIKYPRINSNEREAIAILRSKGYLSNRIAEYLGRFVSSVTREVQRNSDTGVYRAFPPITGPRNGNDILTQRG